MVGEVRVKDEWIQKVVVPKDWDLKFNRLPEWDFSKETEKERRDVFEAVSPHGVTIKAWWDPFLGPKGLFTWTISKKDDLDEYYAEHDGLYTRTVCSQIRIVVNELSGPDWRKYLEICAERKYTIVGDRVFYRSQEDPEVLVCMDENSREELFRKNLAGHRISRIEKHPDDKGLFIFFDREQYVEEDYRRMNRSNFGYFDLEGNNIWWAEPLSYMTWDGQEVTNHVYARYIDGLDMLLVKEENVYATIGGNLATLDIKTGKIKDTEQVEK